LYHEKSGNLVVQFSGEAEGCYFGLVKAIVFCCCCCFGLPYKQLVSWNAANDSAGFKHLSTIGISERNQSFENAIHSLAPVEFNEKACLLELSTLQRN
jgi:hypothetical protein